MSNQVKMSTCKHCGAEIAPSAKICPKCGAKNKKPVYKRGWFIALIAIIIIGAVGSMGENEEKNSSQNDNKNNASTAEQSQTTKEQDNTPEQPVEISYTPYEVSKLMDDLEANALKAADTYKGQYVQITGRLSTIDSSGDYISVLPSDDDFAFTGVQCYIKSDEQKAIVSEMNRDEIVTIKGKITSVGEIFGYSLNIDEIVK